MNLTYRKFKVKDCLFAYLLISGEKEVLKRNFKQIMIDVLTEKYIIMFCNKRVGVFTIRNHEMSIVIRAKDRRNSFAYDVLKKFKEENKDFYFVKINKKNIISINLFKMLGFIKWKMIEDYIYFIKK